MAQFKDKVYSIVASIPKGRVLTYGNVARRAGAPRAARAVGTLMAANTRWPKVPCHRVVHSDGTIGQWSGRGGRNKKISLLTQEGLSVRGGKIENFPIS